MRALVVIPTYQEAGNIARVLQRVRAAVPDGAVLVVDDGSPDGTADLAEAMGREVGQVHVLRRTRKAGLGDAYVAGFRWGIERGAPILVEMDADLQHDPAALPSLLAPIERGEADLVIGSRYVAGGSIVDWPLPRRMLSRWGNRYASTVLNLGVRDSTAGFRAYRTAALAKVDLDALVADGYGFQIEMIYRTLMAGGRVVEVPIQFGVRAAGDSKMSPSIIGEALRMVTWWGFRDRVLRRAASGRPDRT